MAENEKRSHFIVYLEDDAHAFELSSALITADGLACEFLHVEERNAYEKALRERKPDLILADYNVPSIDGLGALELKQEICPQVPFIFVSGSIGEEIAIKSLRNGANDFVLKGSIARLPAAVRRALEEVREQREHQLAEQRLRESEARFRRLTENAPDVIFRLAVQPYVHFEYVSPAITRITGYTPEEFYRDIEILHRLVHPEDHCHVTRAARDGQVDDRVVEVRWMAKDGREIVTEQRYVAVLDEAGKLTAIEGIARDITEWKRERENRRQLEAQLFQAQKLETIGTLAGGIAHDFNNILTGILGYNELARLGLPTGHPVQDDLREVQAAGLRAKDLVAQILTFSRKKESQAFPIDCAATVEEALKLLRASTPSTVEIVRDLHRNVVRADPTEIHQIVLNLCTNAVHAMRGHSGKLFVSLRSHDCSAAQECEIGTLAPGRYAELSIGDTGHGMDVETLRRIFDPFFTTKGVGEGTGLGLALVKGIVTNLHGAVRVKSAPAQGTTFLIYLPLISAHPTGQSAPPFPTGNGESIAIIDDENSISHFVALRLEQLQYRVKVFHDPSVAKRVLSQPDVSFDLVVTDAALPDSSGFDLIQDLRRGGVQTVAIVMTADDTTIPESTLAPIAPVFVLNKPFTGDKLLKTIQQALDASAAHRST